MSSALKYAAGGLGSVGAAYAFVCYLQYSKFDTQVKEQDSKLKSLLSDIERCEVLATKESTKLENLLQGASADQEAVTALEQEKKTKELELESIQKQLAGRVEKLGEKQAAINSSRKTINDLRAKILQQSAGVSAAKRAVEEAKNAREMEAARLNPLNSPQVKELFGKAK